MTGPRAEGRGRLPRRPSRGIAIDHEALRHAREQAGLTLADVAGHTMSKQAVHQFETGKARPTPSTLQVLLDRLGLTFEAIRIRPSDEVESKLARLDELQQYDELEQETRRLLRSPRISERLRAVAHYYAARAALYTAPRRGLQQAQLARRMFVRLGEQPFAAEALDCEAAALYIMQDPSALNVARDALAEYRSMAERHPRTETRMLSNVATYLLQRGRHAEAIGTYREALDVAGYLVDLGRLAQIYHGLSIAFMHTGRTREALDYMDRAVHLSRTEHDVHGTATARLARLENDYGMHLMRLGRWDRAEEMIRAALDHYSEGGIDAGRAHSLLSMGELAFLQNKTDEAIDWTAQAIELAEQRAEPVALASGYQQLGELCVSIGDMDHFVAYFDRALEVLDQAGLRERRAECMVRYQRLKSARSSRKSSS